MIEGIPKPRARERPETFGSPERDTHSLGGFRHAHPDEVAELDQVGSRFVFSSKIVERFVDREEFSGFRGEHDFRFTQFLTFGIAAFGEDVASAGALN